MNLPWALNLVRLHMHLKVSLNHFPSNSLSKQSALASWPVQWSCPCKMDGTCVS